MSELGTKAQEMLEDLPGYFHEDPFTRDMMSAVGGELQRIEDHLELLKEKGRAPMADDDYHLLGFWEWVVGLPVEPPGVSLENRRSKVLAVLRRRRVGAGTGWEDLITRVLGTEDWTYSENDPADYVLTINTPEVTDYTEWQLNRLMRVITPAHLSVVINIEGRVFIVGISEVGDEI